MPASEGSIRLTQYSHGTGCGCKISPKVLETILHSERAKFVDPNLLVGSETHDDAAVYDLGNGTGVIGTTDFFMPITDDPFDFGCVAAANAISDIFAVGDKPIMAIATLGWPINKLSPEITHEIIEGGRYACHQAGIVLTGGCSIDAPEPIFGLAVTGIVPVGRVKRSSTAQARYRLFLTKSLGIGVLTMAEKRSLLKPEHQRLAAEVVCRMNVAGMFFANVEGVKAMTDVTSFDLLGHLSKVCQGADMQTHADYDAIPKSPGVEGYIKLSVVPGDTERNLASYGYLIGEMPRKVRDLLCDPQTSGGLLLAVVSKAENKAKTIATESGTELVAIGELVLACGGHTMVEIR